MPTRLEFKLESPALEGFGKNPELIGGGSIAT
jgi:hypothetical protein